MDTTNINNRLFYLPASISDVQKLITCARQTNKQIRVCGSGHSVSSAIYPDAEKCFGEENILVMLSKMNGVKIDTTTKTVLVEAGCHLGYYPFDPTNLSTPENSLFAQLDAAGFALPDMGGISHQTVGGFLSTGSSGGSIQYSFWDALESITFMPADEDFPQPITVSKSDENPDLFYAVGVSMGLLGIIVSVKFSLIDSFHVKGKESIASISDCPIDISGQGSNEKIALQKFLTDTSYTRLFWYPQPNVARVTVWQAERMKPDEPYKKKPYQEFDPVLGSKTIPQVLADVVYTAFGQWPKWLGDIVGTNNDFYRILTTYVSQNFYPQIFPQILPFFVTEDKVRNEAGDNKDSAQWPQTFQDTWYEGIPMDNGVSDKFFPVEFTELWIPFNEETNRVADVLKKLNELFENYYQNSPRIADGAFCVELYAAKATDFWMSPAYKANVLRVDVLWFKHNLDSPDANYYPLFWEALAEFDFRCHWGKYLPPAAGKQGADYLRRQYPKWNDFLQLRSKYDPNEVFLSSYWKEHLGIETTAMQPPPKKSGLSLTPDEKGYYHPKDEYEISELVKQAVANKLTVRVRGAGQSVNDSIYTDSFQPQEFVQASTHINMVLDNMRNVSIDHRKKKVTVQAGCNLGCDPYDPCGISTEENGLLYQLNKNGLAITNVPDAIPQTVGGFLSTASSASSLSHSFLDAVLSVSLVNGKGEIKTFKRPVHPNPDDLFYGVIVSMGLMGVIFSVTLQCVDSFNVIGKQTIATDDAAPLKIFPKPEEQDLPIDIMPDLKTFLQHTEFARLLWWPHPTAKRLVVWQARIMQSGDYNNNTGTPGHFTPNPYEDPFYPAFLLTEKNQTIKSTIEGFIKNNPFGSSLPLTEIDQTVKDIIEVLTELVVSIIFKVIGKWPGVLKDFGNEINFFGRTLKISDLQQQAEEAWATLFPDLMDIFLPLDSSHPQVFWDNWLTGLNIDKYEFKNKLLPAYRTELWVPIEKASEVMNMLNTYYQNQYFPNADTLNKNIANSFFVIEILSAKRNLFWLSPGYQQDSLRITFNSLKGTNNDVIEYFQQFWDLFLINQIDFRLHWGYFLPKPDSPGGLHYLKQQYPKWEEFLNLRSKMDPHQVFVNQYWQNQLGIQ